MTWKHFTSLAILLGLSFPRAGSAQQTPTLQDLGRLTGNSNTSTVYLAKEFLTMDPQQPRAEAIAVRDGRFIALGTARHVMEVAGTDAKIDRTISGKTVIAGFVEQHVHPVLAALTMNTKVISIEDWDAIDGFSPAVRNPQDYSKRLKEALDKHQDKTKPFVTWGYHHYMHGELSREILNALAPDFPVIVWHRSAHEFFLNDRALTLTAIDRDFVASLPKGAQDQISLEQGHFYEQGALAIMGKLAPYMASPSSFKDGLEYTVKYYHRSGITVCCEPGGFVSKPVQDAINAVYSGDEVPFNHYFMADGKTFAAQHPNDARAMVAGSEQILQWGKGRTAYLPKQVKLFTDGAIFSQLMQMKEGYTDGHHGAWIMEPQAFSNAFQGFWDAGYQIHVHNNGDAGFDVVLGELEKAMKRSPRKDHRAVIVHFGFAQADQVKRWIELGGIVSSNPYYVTALSGPYEKIGIGPNRARNIAPHLYVLDHQGSLSFHSDMPMAPAKPLQLVWAAVNRLTFEGNVAGPEHKVPLDAALKAVTIDAAYAIQLEKRVGSIEVGKDANLTILETSPYDIDPTAIKDIGIWGTMLEGRLQPIEKSVNQSRIGEQQPQGDPQLEELRRRNATDLARIDRRNACDRSSDSCTPGCACQFAKFLAFHIVAQNERPVAADTTQE